MGFLRSKWLLSIGGFLLRRSWGRKLVASFAGKFLEEKLNRALHNVPGAVLQFSTSILYFLIGLVESHLESRPAPARA